MRKRLGIALLALVTLLSSPVASAADICFDMETAKRMVVDLEKCQIERVEKGHLESANIELESQVSALESLVAAHEKMIAEHEKRAEAYKDLADSTKESYSQLLEESKPNALEVVLKSLGLVLIGVMVGMVL